MGQVGGPNNFKCLVIFILHMCEFLCPKIIWYDEGLVILCPFLIVDIGNFMNNFKFKLDYSILTKKV